MRKSIVVAIIVLTVLALSVGPAMADDNSANKGANKGASANKGTNKGDHQGQHKGHGHHKAAQQGSGSGAAKKGTGAGSANLAGATPLASNQTPNTGNGVNSAQEVSFAFKGTLTQDGVQDGPLQVKVDKANDAAKALIGKSLKVNVSPDTEIYRDNANEQNSSLDAKLSDLKAGDEVVMHAKGAPDPNNFTADMISAKPPANTADTPNTNNASLRLAANKNP
jgi:hypothetical protein